MASADNAKKSTRGFGLLEQFLAKQRANLAERLIPAALRTGRILDIGCGSWPLFLEQTEFAAKYGLDKIPGPDRLKLLESHGITFVDHHLEEEAALPFEPDYFAVVTMLAVLEHIMPEKLAGLLGEVRRILKPGGRLIITTPAAWTEGLLILLARLRLVSPVEIEEHQESYNHAGISARLQQAGFSSARMRFGYFELFMNCWATADK